MDIAAYGENYNRAMQGIEDMLIREENPMASFKKSVYPDAFQAYMSRHMATLNAVEAVYLAEENPDSWVCKLADHLVQTAQEELAALPKKRQRDELLINYNMLLAIFVFPAILEKRGQSSEPLSDKIIEKWNLAFKTSVGKASYEKIEEGFHKKFCYITTAVCESQGKPDDCYELELLRSYRDGYLASSEDGQAVVKEYYNIAPTIVNRINREANAGEIYTEIWEDWLSDCVSLIEAGEHETCREKYMDMVYELKRRYMA